MKKLSLKRLLCATIAMSTVLGSTGLVFADETDPNADATVAVEEQEAVDETVTEDDAVIEDEAVVEDEDVISEETSDEEVPAEDEDTSVSDETIPEEDSSVAEEEIEVIEEEVIIEDEIIVEDEIVEDIDEEVIGIEVEEEDIVFEEAEAKNGWEQQGTNWYYYENGEMVHGWKKIGKNWYYFFPAMARGIYTINYNSAPKTFVFDDDGKMLTGWVQYYNYWYYCTSSGAVTGWKKIGKKYYYFDVYQNVSGYYGAMYRNRSLIEDGKKYLFNNSGVMQTGWTQPFKTIGDYTYYYCRSDGSVVYGWKKIGKKWYYFNTSSGSMVTGRYSITDETGKLAYYFFGDNGAMKTGWVQPYANYYGSWYYYEKDGRGANGWKKFSGKWYYFTDGSMATGETYIDGKYYYFTPYQYDANGRQVGTVGAMKTGWIEFYGYYYNDSDMTAWKYYGSDGSRVNGWKKISNKWYYFSSDGIMARGFTSIYESGRYTYYYFSNSGVMKTGWVQYMGYYYYMTSSGSVRDSWKKIGGKWYYFDYNCRMVTGYYSLYVQDYGRTVIYHFADDGHCYNPNAKR